MIKIAAAALVLFAAECLALPAQGNPPAPSVAPNIAAGLGDGFNFDFSVSEAAQPFSINVNPAFTVANKLKASLYRPSKRIAIPTWSDGPPTASMASLQEYYLQNYSRANTQQRLNDHYAGALFSTTVSAGPNYTEPVHLQFAHRKSNRSDAIRLIMLHGFPSSFLEFEYM